MDIESRLSLSFYKTIATISESHKIYIVQHLKTSRIYIKKILDVYNRAVYEYLRENPLPHTPRIYEIYEEDSTLVIIEEYISGSTLEQQLEDKVPLSDDTVREIAIQICIIVNRLHNCDPAIIHRDIKPSNIIISPSGEVYLLDFNAAKYYSDSRDEDTVLLGTKGYAAPEQYGFGVSTPQTDIYAIGMLLKEMTHCAGYTGDAQRNEFAPIIARCTRLDASERYKDVAAVLRKLNKSNPVAAAPEKTLPAWTTYLPPGFQKLSPLNMVLAGVGYAFTFWVCLGMEVKGASPTGIVIERFMTLLMILSMIFCSANYRNIQSHFPPCRTNNKILRILAVILLDGLLFLAFMFVMILMVNYTM